MLSGGRTPGSDWEWTLWWTGLFAVALCLRQAQETDRERWVRTRILSRRSLFRKALFMRRISRVGSPVPPLPPPSSCICKDGEAMVFLMVPRRCPLCVGKFAVAMVKLPRDSARDLRKQGAYSLSAHFLFAAVSPPPLFSIVSRSLVWKLRDLYISVWPLVLVSWWVVVRRSCVVLLSVHTEPTHRLCACQRLLV